MLRLMLPVVVLGATAVAAFDGAFKPQTGGPWDVSGGPVVYLLDPGGSADLTGDDSELDAVRDSFRAWACVEGTSLRFEEGPEPGPRTISLQDGKNTVFWDETGNDCLMGPATLGITLFDPEAATRVASDICFNGFNFTWGIGKDADVQTVAVHEVGHFIGLDHPCDDENDTATCLPQSDSIMFPSGDGSISRELQKGDIAGAVSLYPSTGDDSGCLGPFRAGERCTCNDECVEGLVCAPDATGDLRCGSTCSAQDRNCGAGSVCVLDAPVDEGEAVGLCVRAAAPDLPAGAICVNGTDCASGTCAAVIALGSSICQVPCEGNGDCAGGTCFEGFCVGGFESEACPVEVEGCGCAVSPAAGDDVGPVVGVAVAGVVFGLVGRRRRRTA